MPQQANIGVLLKALTPLINQRIAALESGKIQPGAPAGSEAKWLNRANFNSLAGTNATLTALPNNYKSLPTDIQYLLASTRQLQAEAPQPHHSSLLDSVFHDIEKPFRAVVGAVESATSNADKNYSHENALQRILSNAKAIGHGAAAGWEGKSKAVSVSDLMKEFPNQHGPSWLPKQLDVIQQDQLHNTRLGKGAIGFVGDVGLDPLSYTGAGTLTKIRTLGRTAEAISKAQEAERIIRASEAGKDIAPGAIQRTLLGGDLQEGKYLAKSQIPNSAVKAHVMKNAKWISEQYGHLTYEAAYKDNLVKAEQQLAGQGIKKYDTLSSFRKALKGNATSEDLAKWNASVESDITRGAGKLTGDRTKWVEGKASELLGIATKTNLAGDAATTSEQMKKALGIKFGGKTVAKITMPKAVLRGTKSLYEGEKLKGIREFNQSIHGHFNTVFRTGSHIDPLVNSMRMASHSSLVDRMNNEIRNTNSIWGHISRPERARLARAIASGATNVVVKGGKNLDTGLNVDHLVQHATNELDHIQSLVGKRGSGKLVTYEEFNAALPTYYRIPPKYFKSENWLRDAWQSHFLHPDASYHLHSLGKDPAVFLLAMKKAAFSAAASKELPEQITKRFGHELYKVDPLTRKKISKTNPVTRVLVDRHGYRAPMITKPSGAKQIIKGYEGHVFHDDVARGIEAIHRMLHGDENFRIPGMTSPPAQFFDKVTSLFKTVVTKFNPGFHERNLFGEVMSSMADGVVSVTPYRKALQVLRLHGRLALDTGEAVGTRHTLIGRTVEDARVHNGILPDAYRRARIAPVNGDDIVMQRKFHDLATKGVTADQLWHAYVSNGLKTGWITTDTGKYAGRFGGAGIGTHINTKVQHLTENIEDYARLAHFISRIERSKFTNFERAAEEAATYVRKYHFDYNDFTQFEKSVVSKIIPFYKWTRKNIPLQMSLLFQKPGYFLSQMKALNAISNTAGFANNGAQIPQAEEVMPQWLKDHLAVPVGMGSSGTRYLDAPLPTLQALQFFGASPSETEQNAAYMTNPLMKILFETSTGHQIGGAPVQSGRYWAGQTPYTNLLHNLLSKNNTGKSTNLLQFLLGPGMVENTPARIKSELKREQSAAAAVRKKYRAKQHLAPLNYMPLGSH